MEYFYPEVVRALAPHVPLEPAAIEALLSTPPDPKLGDIAFPCFPLAKALRKVILMMTRRHNSCMYGRKLLRVC